VFKEHAERELCKHAVMSYHKDRGLEVDFWCLNKVWITHIL
jgi:hypothetical protein